MADQQSTQNSTPVYTIYVCPQCGDHITESDYDPAIGRIWGHYHDPPADWPEGEDPWFDAAPIEVVPRCP